MNLREVSLLIKVTGCLLMLQHWPLQYKLNIIIQFKSLLSVTIPVACYCPLIAFVCYLNRVFLDV